MLHSVARWGWCATRELIAAGCTRLVKDRFALVPPIPPVENEAVDVDVKIGRRAKSLNERHRAAVSGTSLAHCLLEQETGDDPVHDMQHRGEQFGMRRIRTRSREITNMLSSKIVVIGLLFSAAVPALAHDLPRRLPLGDGRIGVTPAIGRVLVCNMQFPGGGGAHRVGGWIRDGYWYPGEKPRVEGAVTWPNARVDITVEGRERVVRANALPRHATGVFPIRPGSTAHDYDRNPNSIREQQVLLRLPAEPQAAERPACVPLGMIGFTIAGVAVFNAFDLQGRDAPAYEVQDACNGHPQRRGLYHYHDWSPCMVPADHPADRPVGWMLDGFPILGPRAADGRALTNADLDECHGRVGEVEIDGRRVTTYHYRFTFEYPYTIGCFRGTPIALPRGGAGGGGARPSPGQVLESAARELGVDPSRLRAAVGPPLPNFERAAREQRISADLIRAAFDRARTAAN